MTVVYPLTAQLDYIELKFSLRSIEKYLSSPFEVVIIGDTLPEWITNITHIKLPDVKGKKQLSIRRKILAALEYSNEILFFNDDVFLLKEQTAFPYFFHGFLKNYPESGARPLYDQLLKEGKPVKHFDGHFPLVYQQCFIYASERYSDECILKSMYCNDLEIEGTFAPDCKLVKEMKPEQIKEFLQDKPCFSTGVHSLKSALPILEELYPNKSKFEI